MDTELLLKNMDMESIHEGALKILEDIGLQLPSLQTQSRIAGFQGLRVKNGRVFVSRELAESIVADMRSTAQPPVQKEWRFGGGGACHWLLDFDGKMKPFTSKNLPDAIRLTQACKELGLSSGCPGAPTDEPAPLQALMQMRLAAEYFGMVSQANTGEIPIAEFCLEMLQVFDKKFVLGPHVVSPLRLVGDEWDLAVAFLDRIPKGTVSETISVGNMPALGATAPCDYEAAWAQSMAETLGGAAVLKGLGAPKVEAWGTLYAFDLRGGNWIYGSPEHALITLMEAKLRRFYGLPPRGAKSLETSVGTPNSQAAFEKTFHTTLAAMAGYTGFGGAGCLGVDDIWSPAQLMIDIDIVHGIRHILTGTHPAEKVNIVEAVRAGLEEGNFLAADLTVERLRRVYWFPKLFEYQAVGKWVSGSTPDSVKKASEMAAERLSSFKGGGPVLDEHRRKELDRIISRARETLVG